jgi:hypothetical protein
MKARIDCRATRLLKNGRGIQARTSREGQETWHMKAGISCRTPRLLNVSGGLRVHASRWGQKGLAHTKARIDCVEGNRVHLGLWVGSGTWITPCT